MLILPNLICIAPPSLIGLEGQGYVWHDEWEEEDEDELDPRNKIVGALGFDLSPTSNDVLSDDESVMSGASESEDDGESFNELARHYTEVEETLKRAIAENHTVDNASLELNALKFACNITFHDLRVVTIPVLLLLIDLNNISKSVQKVCFAQSSKMSYQLDFLIYAF